MKVALTIDIKKKNQQLINNLLPSEPIGGLFKCKTPFKRRTVVSCVKERKKSGKTERKTKNSSGK